MKQTMKKIFPLEGSGQALIWHLHGQTLLPMASCVEAHKHQQKHECKIKSKDSHLSEMGKSLCIITSLAKVLVCSLPLKPALRDHGTLHLSVLG